MVGPQARDALRLSSLIVEQGTPQPTVSAMFMAGAAGGTAGQLFGWRPNVSSWRSPLSGCSVSPGSHPLPPA